MSITREVVLRTALLAHLEIGDEEAGVLSQQLSSILDYMDQLGELDTSDIPPMSHSTLAEEVDRTWRRDEPRPSLGQSIATANAPEAFHGYFKVPSVITRATGDEKES